MKHIGILEHGVNYIAVPLSALYHERRLYDVYPKCQREFVWNPTMQKRLIDSILRGLPIPPLTILVDKSGMLGPKYWIVDGQQRMKTILGYMNNEFRTAKTGRSYARMADDPSLVVIEPDKLYTELSIEAKSRFDQYPLQLSLVSNVPVEYTGLLFRRMNYQVKLTLAERLASFSERKAQDVHEKIISHDFFREIYAGKYDRKQPFQMTLMFILMEMWGGFANLTSPRLLDIASGQKDDVINDVMITSIGKHLDYVLHLFQGVNIRSLRSVVPMYQAVILLEREGCNIKASHEGCLAFWFNELLELVLRNRDEFGVSGDEFTVLTRVNKQHQFWQDHFRELKEIDGLVFRDGKRMFSVLDRVSAWNRQEGKCTVCGKAVRVNDIAHHVEHHANGGKTEASNCQLVHKKCHDELHRQRLL